MGVDYFFPGYAVWAKLIEAAADMGYDTNNLVRCCFCCLMYYTQSKACSRCRRTWTSGVLSRTGILDKL